ncbi:MAG: LD-carboxypeptidase [Bacteroidetes bacterium GWE2_29_8]|nr:MAG: LD-carboxypeptidase [Bacteroidetes bacterium GWE2_29_8]OFY17758.1 MAG: LD-carboxypeptidase [Bacteroidetes bacterium GWF2_29_10]
MLIPQILKKGDKIGIVAPARKISHDEIKNAVDYITSWGYEVVFGDSLFADSNQYAGTDDDRANDFQKMLNNNEIKAILCARGGYGSLRIIDMLDFSNYQINPKWIIGYSDITVFHLTSNLKYNIASLHATMPINFPDINNPNNAVNDLKSILQGEPISYKSSNNSYNKKGTMWGPVVGGNLSVLYSLQGSFDINLLKDKVLFIEDLDEYLYHIDRMIISMKRAGWFKEINGLIVGGMTDMRDNTIPFGKNPCEIITEALAEYNFPICFDFPSGHIEENIPIILGKKILLKV